MLSRIAGEDPAVLDQAFVAQCVSLGRSGATFQITRTDDTPRRLYIGGRAAAAIKEFICKGTVNAIAKEGRKPGSYSWYNSWLKGGKRPSHEVVTES